MAGVQRWQALPGRLRQAQWRHTWRWLSRTRNTRPAGPITPESDATTYNNYYEFGDDKSIWRAAQRLPVTPWQVEIAGLVDKPRVIDLADLMKQVPVEERVYRHRCVETWAMTVPWTGFPVSALLKVAQPSSAAKYLVFESAALPKVMPGPAGQRLHLPLCRRDHDAGGPRTTSPSW